MKKYLFIFILLGLIELGYSADVDIESATFEPTYTGAATFTNTVVMSSLTVTNRPKNAGVATAWVLFNGASTSGTIYDSFNVSSCAYVSGGVYNIKFTKAMDNDDYVAVGAALDGYFFSQYTSASKTTTQFKTSVRDSAGNAVDSDPIQVLFFGGKNGE